MIWSFLFAILTVANFAFADEINILKNPGFESRTAQWVKTGSSTFTIESAAPLEGTYSAIWDASATAEFFRSSTYTVPAGMYGATCVIQMKYLWDSGTSGHILMNVDDGTNNVAQLSLDPTSGGVPRNAQLSFTCPSSGTMRFELESTANAAAITLDGTYVGTGKNTVQISQTELFAGVMYHNIANCDVQTTSGTVAEVANDADCSSRSAVGQAQFVNNQFKMLVAKLPRGRYELSTMVPVYSDASGTTCEFYVRAPISQMTASYGAVGFITGLGSNPIGTMVNNVWNQTADASSVEFYMEWRRTAGAGTCHMATLNAGGAPFSMSLKRYPTTSAEAITLDTSGWRVDASISGANPSLGTASQASYIGVEDASLTLVNNVGMNVVPAQIPCSSTNPSTGTTCAAGNESVGVAFSIPTAGDVLACVSFGTEINVGATGALEATFQVVETANTSQTIVQEGKSRAQYQYRTPSTLLGYAQRVCGTFSFASAGQKTLRLMYEQLVVATLNSHLVLADAASNRGQRDIHWEVMPVNQQQPAPVFPDIRKKVESNAQGERIERARINNNGSACPIISQSGTWISGTSRSGTGTCALTFAGSIWTSAPACVVMTAGGAADVANQAAVTPSTTTMTVSTFVSNTAAASDKAFDIICMGPK